MSFLRHSTLIIGTVAALAGCHHAVAPVAAAPSPAPAPVLLHPRLPVDRAGGWTLGAVDDPALEDDESRFALAILQRHPSGLPRAAVRETAKAVVEEAHANGLDPLLVLALVRVESTNWNWSRSEKDARGLMQILPSTGKLLAKKGHVAWAGPDSLYDPRVNVRLGTLYLAQLLARFDGDLPRALIAYNEGPNGSARTEDYATKILWFADRYHAIVAGSDSLTPGIARVALSLDQIERDIDGKPSVALARAHRARRMAASSRRADLNRITFSDLLLLDPQMTPRAARTIVDFRATSGGFHSLDDLDLLGLDAALVRRLRERVVVAETARTVAAR